MAKHNELGKWGEDFAAEYLKEQGYVIRDRDWHCGKRDIDLVAISADLTTIVFVEVKTRTSDEVSEPADAVNKQKIRMKMLLFLKGNFRVQIVLESKLNLS